MPGWQQVARDCTPEPLSADQAALIRHAAVATAREIAARPRSRRSPIIVIGGMLITAVTTGIFVARAQPERSQPSPVVSPAALRQLQFATPGGTRIIWQFNPDFSLRESLP